MENKELNTQTAQDPEQIREQIPEQIGQEQPEKEERLFTQAEVNAIIKKRLQRAETERTTANDSAAAELAKREARLNCREYLLDNGYSTTLLEILGTDDFEAFKKKAEAIYTSVTPPAKYPTVKDAGEIRKLTTPEDEIETIFKSKNVHKPKKPTGVY